MRGARGRCGISSSPRLGLAMPDPGAVPLKAGGGGHVWGLAGIVTHGERVTDSRKVLGCHGEGDNEAGSGQSHR